MTAPHTLHVHPSVPGAVAAYLRGDGEGAALLIAQAMTDTPPLLVGQQLIQFTTFGWLGLLDRYEVTVDVSEVEHFWNELARVIVADNT